MKPNVGTADRIVRLIAGIVLIGLPFLTSLALFQGTLATAISVILGLILLGTAVTRVCPLYSAFGIRTCGT